MEKASTGTLLVATLTMGHMVGVFAVYAYAIMPGLRKTDDRTFVWAFQEMDRSILNPWMLTSFVGALILIGLAGVLNLGADDRSSLPWIVAAFVLYLAVFVITIAINVPLNDDLKAAGDPTVINVAAAREAFHEAWWIGWNVVRAVLSAGAFTSLAWALVLRGRDTA